MFKIVVADDNALTRQAFRASPLWEECGFELAGEAANGPDALRLIREQKPDAALVDIKMPGLTGLELIRLLRGEGSGCLFVIISAYDEFSFAQQGVKLGVFDYLLKPVDDQELARVLMALGQKLREMRDRFHTAEAARPASEAPGRISHEQKSRLLSEACNGITASARELEDALRREWRFHGYELLLVSPEFLTKGGAKEELEPFLSCQAEILRECARQSGVHLLETWRSEGLSVLMACRRVELTREYNLAALELARHLFSANEHAGWQVCVGISNFKEKLRSLPEAMEECIQARDGRFFLENKTIVHYGTLKSRSVHNGYLMVCGMQDIYGALRDRPEELPDALQRFFALIRREYSYDAEAVRNLFIQIALMATCIEAEKFPGASGLKSVDALQAEVRGMESVGELCDWLEAYAQELASLSRENGSAKFSPISRRALNYLHQHYADHITLAEVARTAGVSESHLCRSLKNDTGETFVNLLNKIRIQRAIRLLREGKYKVYEIADLVGFRNYAYFYQLFKRITGFPPTEYQ